MKGGQKICKSGDILSGGMGLGRFSRGCCGTEEARWQPAYHWTDQKIKVHGFYCVLALLLSALARKVAIQAEIEPSLPEMLKELSAIREVTVIYPKGTLAHRKDHITLSRMNPRQRKLADCLEIGLVLGG